VLVSDDNHAGYRRIGCWQAGEDMIPLGYRSPLVYGTERHPSRKGGKGEARSDNDSIYESSDVNSQMVSRIPVGSQLPNANFLRRKEAVATIMMIAICIWILG
jgi:hypothetical protein